jgi:xanthine/uracil permease
MVVKVTTTEEAERVLKLILRSAFYRGFAVGTLVGIVLAVIFNLSHVRC